MPSLTARTVQSLMSAVFARALPHDEAPLRKALQQGRRRTRGDPPASLYKQCAVDVRVVDGDRILESFQRPEGTKIVITWQRVR